MTATTAAAFVVTAYSTPEGASDEQVREVGRYTTKGSANRAAKKLADRTNVWTVEDWDEACAADAAADAKRVAQAEAVAARADEAPADAVVEAATDVVADEAAKVTRERLAPASRKLTRDQKRALSAFVRDAVEAAMARAMDGSRVDAEDEDDIYLPATLEANEDDIIAQVAQWMSYLPSPVAADEVA